MGNPLDIRKLRKAARVSLEELSAAVGITRQSLASYERGFTVPSPELLAKILEALGKTSADVGQPMTDWQAKYIQLLEEYNHCLKEMASIKAQESGKKNRPDSKDAA